MLEGDWAELKESVDSEADAMSTADSARAVSPGNYVADLAPSSDEQFTVFLTLRDDGSYHMSYDNVSVRRCGEWCCRKGMLHFQKVEFEEDGMVGSEDDVAYPYRDVTDESFEIKDPRESSQWFTYRIADPLRADYQQRFKQIPDFVHAATGYPHIVIENAAQQFDIVESVASHMNVRSQRVYPQPCTYLTTHLVCMRIAGWTDVDFDELAAVSGASALFGYEHGSFMPKYASQYINMAQHIAEATGFACERLSVEDPERAWGSLVESVDAGVALKGWEAEMVVFAGYQKAAARDDRKIYVMSDGASNYKGWWLWDRFVKWTQ